jgi:hypothetical protein
MIKTLNLFIQKYGFTALSKRIAIGYIENLRENPAQSYP